MEYETRRSHDSSLSDMLAKAANEVAEEDEQEDDAEWTFENDEDESASESRRERLLVRRSFTAEPMMTPPMVLSLSSSMNEGEEKPMRSPPRTPAQRRLRELFGIPQNESLLAEYMCALHKKILLQGKMYVFENYICFHSNVFGYVKMRTIPFRRITLLSKARTILPTAQIMWNGKTDFFTSFVFPDRSFRLITDQWHKKSAYGKLFSSMSGKEQNGDEVENDAAKAALKSSEADRTDNHDDDDLHHDDDDDDDDEDDEDDVESPKDFGDVLMMLPMKMPLSEQSSTMIELQNCTMDCSAQEFFAALWSNKSRENLLPKVAEALEQTGVEISDWIKMRKKSTQCIGCVREMHFTVPVRQTFGPSSTRCHQTQRYAWYSDLTLVINTSQVQTDVPYGDYFRVESRWVCRQLSEKKCSVWVGTEVKFNKSTMMKSLIVSSVIDESKVVVPKMIELAHDHMNPSPKRQASRKRAPMEVVDISKLHIPDASKDVVWSMLKPFKSFVKAGAAENSALKGATPWRKTCVYCSIGARLFVLIILVLLAHALMSISARALFGGISERIFGKRIIDETIYWETKSKVLANELTSLQRRMELLAKEVEHAKRALASARR